MGVRGVCVCGKFGVVEGRKSYPRSDIEAAPLQAVHVSAGIVVSDEKTDKYLHLRGSSGRMDGEEGGAGRIKFELESVVPSISNLGSTLLGCPNEASAQLVLASQGVITLIRWIEAGVGG
jgi:hypothetical protein